MKPWLWSSILLLLFAAHASAQHHTMVDEELPPFNATGEEPMSYALFPDNKGYFYMHVGFMVLAFWVLMPIGIMFGIARSSLHIPTQILAFGVAMLGFFFGQMYGHSVPHLYAGNVHHSMGWILFLFMIAQLFVGVVRKISKVVGRNQESQYNRLETVHLMNRPSSSSSDDHHHDHHSEASSAETLNNFYDENDHDHDNDSFGKQHLAPSDEELLDEDPITMAYEKPPLYMRAFNAVSPYIPNFMKKFVVVLAYNSIICRYIHLVLGRTFIVLIFIQTLSGLVVYHGVCRSWDVLGCIAHLIKGGIFFFYGMMTLGRYLGAFAERGWAWNRVDGGSRFSFEMIESGLIFTYGITNTWMEHFGQDSAWTHKDLEHASLAFMWWWCGLAGILVESRALRRLLERSVMNTPLDVPKHEPHQTYSLNPFPALTVLMTGISMGNHHQDSQYSTNVHYMWGLLLSLAACCRFITYISLYRKSPKGTQPTRPPSELLGAFLLIAGSILFMASNSGTLTWLRRNQVDSMFMMNVCVALTSMTMCYVTGLMIIKAWSKKREDRKTAHLRKNHANNNIAIA
ncbi:uncharacterized protein BYT42DRAFT_564508 [Radiomyces spectabilis]|uniref:uncharacterized protein n=1 Tax=Radiomyces spectabilis TaxID=64574 RepID=UPI002220F5B0|nr:uncharacterized protein BYT42DRAFT_564508 [Radiomyces spectabilis]KAI8385050.1 hypothetical protein BYT42DRAFT_564508 [Radiomyces spectabilis]